MLLIKLYFLFYPHKSFINYILFIFKSASKHIIYFAFFNKYLKCSIIWTIFVPYDVFICSVVIYLNNAAI